MVLVKSADFGKIKCDFYGDGEDFWMSRNQVGTALEYANPTTAIKNLHSRYKKRLDKFSRVAQIEPPSGGGVQDTIIYNRKGIMEICRHSDQPKADAFMDFCWDIMDGLMSGNIKIIPMTSYQEQSIVIQKAKLLNQIAAEYSGTYKQILQAYAAKELTGEFILPLPAIERKTYSAGEIGEMLGISAHKVGTLANSHNLKNAEYGKWFVDKSPHSRKEVQSFRYFDSVIPVMKGFL